MKTYLTKTEKSKKIINLLNQALEILESVGIPIEGKTERALERMALCFLAVSGVRGNWAKARSNIYLKSRDIIQILNTEFEEKISSGSYDDIRRKDLKLMVVAGLIINSSERPDAATNDPTRGYSLSPEFCALIQAYGSTKWSKSLAAHKKTHQNLAQLLARKRNLPKIPVTLPGGKQLKLSLGQHNELQKRIIEDFLPRFGAGSTILYIGDTSNKSLHLDDAGLKAVDFFDLSHDELPDIIAYNKTKNWLYLIEAVHSSGPMSEIRMLELKKLLTNCSAQIIFVTAFLTRTEMRKWMLEIAWESEVWLAENPDHMIHFNGEKFLGPYTQLS